MRTNRLKISRATEYLNKIDLGQQTPQFGLLLTVCDTCWSSITPNPYDVEALVPTCLEK